MIIDWPYLILIICACLAIGFIVGVFVASAYQITMATENMVENDDDPR